MNLPDIQAFMRDRKIDAWLVHDFRSCNPVLEQLLPGKRHLTRRCALLIPATGEPRLAAHSIDASAFAKAGVAVDVYLRWQEYQEWLRRELSRFTRVAMEYSPGCSMPVVGIVDAGTIELVRSVGVEVVSSADLIQMGVAVWSDAAAENHRKANLLVTAIKDGAFDLIRTSLASGTHVDEYQVQQFILKRFAENGLETADAPIVGVNGHGGDPHFSIDPANPAPIRKGDWVLIDLWARIPGDQNIHSDITWVGYAGAEAPPEHRRVYEAVRAGRDAAVDLVRQAWASKSPVQGWQVDEAARAPMISAGYEKNIRHRTGHSLSTGPMVHGIGVNIDNLETHDTRLILPRLGFTVEPGLYFPNFGVRLEIDVWMNPQNGPEVTSCLQTEIVRLA